MNLIKIPYEDLSRTNEVYFNELQKKSNEVIRSGWYVLGENVRAFEKEFSDFNQSNFCIGVASGLDALILGLSVFDFPVGSKVLVPSNTYIATILAIIRSGLIPILVEPNENTCNIDLIGIQKNYTPDCVAVIVVHLYGRLCDMESIIVFAKSSGMKIIEDCAQSHFAENGKINAGNFGDIGAFSFYPTKNLGALGDAGAIVCKDEEIYLKLRALRNYGSHVKYYNNFIGWNSRLDELQAAFLRIKLKDITSINNRKREIANLYFTFLKDIKGIILPLTSGLDNVWHIFNIRSNRRDDLRNYLLCSGIGTEIHYPIPPSEQIAYNKLFENDDYPISVKIHKETLSLPISYWLTDSEVELISIKIREFFELG